MAHGRALPDRLLFLESDDITHICDDGEEENDRNRWGDGWMERERERFYNFYNARGRKTTTTIDNSGRNRSSRVLLLRVFRLLPSLSLEERIFIRSLSPLPSPAPRSSSYSPPGAIKSFISRDIYGTAIHCMRPPSSKLLLLMTMANDDAGVSVSVQQKP